MSDAADRDPDDLVFQDLVVTRAEPAAVDIVRYELRAADGGALPPFAPGAHIPVRTPAGVVRRYSLANDPAEDDRYEIAVKRDAAGRGGSASMVDTLAPGSRLPVAAPRNEFALHPRAQRFLFIAGGIGITPVMAMMRHLAGSGGPRFALHYCTRSLAHTAFAGELAAADWRDRVHLHHDDGDPARAFDFWPLLEKPQAGTHIYCCGPRALMDTVRDMSGHWAGGSVHFESFGVDAALRRTDHPFRVRLARSGATYDVPADRSLLEVLREHGMRVRSSCEAGSCGTCRTGLCAGEVEHRDFVLGPDEQATQIMVCVSRARGDEITLDL
ncbi:MAG: PDR/VanB family oxidoreductase [Burkholderiales bacterium]